MRASADRLSKLVGASRVTAAPISSIAPMRSGAMPSETSTSRGGEAGQFRAKPHGRAGQDVEIARGNIAPGQRPLAPDLGECGQVVVASCLEQRILGQRAGGDQPHHLAPDHGLGPAALLRLGGVFHLFADRDAKPLADQGQKVAFGTMRGHAAPSGCLRPRAARAWSARCRAPPPPRPRRRRTSRRNRPSGRTGAHRHAAP